MLKKLLFGLVLFLAFNATGQECPTLINPLDGATDVSVNETISWTPVESVPGYRIQLGTAMGQNDITDVVVGSTTSYTAPRGLPENTEIFVTIVLSFFSQNGGGEDIVCEIGSFTTEDVTTPPDCTQIQNPVNGATNVSVFTNISWLNAPTATSYDISIGTTPGGAELFSETDLSALNFLPSAELPINTLIYVTIIPKNENGSASSCEIFSFTTGEVAPLPGCTNLITPSNGATSVPLTPFLEWAIVPEATGYIVTIGTTPEIADILDNASFNTNSTFVIDFEPNKTFFITITPFNAAGEAINCGQESFSTLLGCGPFLDLDTGELINLNPEFEYPEIFSFCENDTPLELTAPIDADGYRWFFQNQFGEFNLISEERELDIDETGNYQLEIFNFITQPGDIIECATMVDFEVVSSEIATIDNLNVSDTASGLQIIVEASGNGDYEYAIDDINGPYQDSNIFNGIVPDTHTLYVRDRNGCGIVEETIVQDLTVEGFPKFFTPNGDLINDFWQFRQPPDQNITFISIQVFDRFGTLLQQIDQNGLGWDGTFNGRRLPTGGYWYRAVDDTQREIRGNFTLKR